MAVGYEVARLQGKFGLRPPPEGQRAFHDELVAARTAAAKEAAREDWRAAVRCDGGREGGMDGWMERWREGGSGSGSGSSGGEVEQGPGPGCAARCWLPALACMSPCASPPLALPRPPGPPALPLTSTPHLHFTHPSPCPVAPSPTCPQAAIKAAAESNGAAALKLDPADEPVFADLEGFELSLVALMEQQQPGTPPMT